ncbi:MAG: DUF1223 domain-containing protein [Dokdonella sp.]
MWSRLSLIGITLLGCAFVVSASPAHAAQTRPVVVELFTSQGCSSCPPADAYLNELARSRDDVLTLAFHVTYWNDLGWKDPFSLEASTQRQRRFSQRFGAGPYTPMIVVDGESYMVGSNRGQVASAITKAKKDIVTAAPIGITREGSTLSISVGAGEGQGEVLLVGFDREHTTKVGRGENGGRALTESSAVRSIRSVGKWSGSALTISEQAPDGENVAVLLQSSNGHIVGAARLDGKSAPMNAGLN